MKVFAKHPLAFSAVASLALTGCFGGSSSSDDNGDSTIDLSPVTAENERDISISAAESIEGLFSGENTTESFSDALGGISSSSTQSAGTNISTSSNSCTEGDISISQDGDTISYNIDGSCDIELNGGQTATISGGYIFASRDWSDQPCNNPQFSNEFIWGGNPIFTGEGAIDFYIEGGYGFRLASQMPQPVGDGDYCFAFEYGSTSEGLVLETPDRSVEVGPNTSSGVTVTFTVVGDDVFNYSEEVTAGGVFELEEDAFYEVSTSGLELTGEENVDEGSVGDSSQFQPSGQFCPYAGTVTVSGADGSQVEVFFGKDAADPYEVQVIGDVVTEYETCDDFYNDDPVTG